MQKLTFDTHVAKNEKKNLKKNNIYTALSVFFPQLWSWLTSFVKTYFFVGCEN